MVVGKVLSCCNKNMLVVIIVLSFITDLIEQTMNHFYTKTGVD